MQSGCLQVHQGTSWKIPNLAPWEGAPAGLGVPGPLRPLLAHTLLAGAPHVGKDSTEKPPATGSRWTKGLNRLLIVHSLPSLAPYFPVAPEYLVFSEEAKSLLYPLPQYSALSRRLSHRLTCPSCLLRQTPAPLLRTNSRVTPSMKLSLSLPMLIRLFFLCLSSLCYRAEGLSKGIWS